MKHDLSAETKQANLLKLLTHPVRIAILQILRQDEACVCHLEATLGYRQAYLSQQIAVLREGGLITDRKDGWNVYYHLINPQVLKILDSMVFLLDESPAQLPSTSKNCPCPKCNLKNETEN
ncbi:MAG: ArsR family transcriptional regulator [Chloroflexi bacterium HGW-Chloroflexi-8]|jgi:ArsR family transcriptional regulator|nr:MAG: ArsR family transcriptional regulator [Chloroflexi bacterium HGW-Chloroflexi-8]